MTQIPDSRVPFPEPFTPPNGKCASAPVVEMADELDLSSMSNDTSEPVMATAEPSVGSSASDDDDDLSIFKELARS